MKGYGKSWASAKSHEAPDDPASVSLTPSSFSYSSDLQTVQASFTNKGGKDVKLSSVVLKFTSGSGGGAFFAEKKQYAVNADTAAGNVKIDGFPQECTVRVLNLGNAVVREHMDTTLTVLNPKISDDKTQPDFVLSKDGCFTITMFGVVRDDKGDPCSMIWQVFAENGDMSAGQLNATRGKKP